MTSSLEHGNAPHGIVDAWAQLPTRPDQIAPEVRRLFERSGTADVLERGVIVDDVIAAMHAAGIDVLMLSA